MTAHGACHAPRPLPATPPPRADLGTPATSPALRPAAAMAPGLAEMSSTFWRDETKEDVMVNMHNVIIGMVTLLTAL